MTLRTSPRRLGLGENLPVEAGWDLVSCQCFFGGNGLIILSSYYPGLGWGRGRGRKCNLVPRVSHLNAWGERGETLSSLAPGVKMRDHGNEVGGHADEVD